MQYVIIAQQAEANLDVQATLRSLLCIVLNSKLRRFSFPPTPYFTYPPYLSSPISSRFSPPFSISHFTTYHITEASTNYSRARALFRLLTLPPSSHGSRPTRTAWLGCLRSSPKGKKTVWPSAVKTHSIPFLSPSDR